MTRKWFKKREGEDEQQRTERLYRTCYWCGKEYSSASEATECELKHEEGSY